MTPSDEVQVHELDIVEHKGRIGFDPHFPAAVIGVPRRDSPAAAGLRTFDLVTSVNGRRIERFVDLVDALSRNRGDQVVVSYLRPIDVPHAMGGLCDLGVLEPGAATLTPLPRTPGTTSPSTETARMLDVLERTGIESADMYVAFVPEASGEWLAGAAPGRPHHHARRRSRSGSGARSRTSWSPAPTSGTSCSGRATARPWPASFTLRKEQWDDEFGQHYERYVFRTDHWLPSAPDRLVANPHPLAYALRRGIGRDGERHRVHQRRHAPPGAGARRRSRA